jgi:hypothetical protein
MLLTPQVAQRDRGRVLAFVWILLCFFGRVARDLIDDLAG